MIRIPVLSISLVFFVLIMIAAIGSRFVGNDGRSDFPITRDFIYLPGNNLNISDCNYFERMRYYPLYNENNGYCIINKDGDPIKSVSITVDPYDHILSTHIIFTECIVDFDDVLSVFPGTPKKRYKFRSYAYISWDNISVLAKVYPNKIGYYISAIRLFDYGTILK